MKKKHSKLRGFTLIELLVVIAVIGILMGMVGPRVFDLLTSSKVKKSQSIFRSWVTQLYQYKEYYKYFPPFLARGRMRGSPFYYLRMKILMTHLL